MIIPDTLGASLFKPYAIAIAPDGESVEIDMYGEVVKNRPTDESGNPAEDNYIVEAEFLKDISAIKQSGVKNITLRLNSVGGAVFSAITIYNKLMEMDATITARVDGVAMSAAFLIMQAADVIEVFPSSLLMLHTASMCIAEYCNALDLHKKIGLLESCDSAIINAIKRKTGKSEQEITKALQLETYMTGSEAVEMGYADKLIEDDAEGLPIVASADRRTVYAAGREIKLPFGYELPEDLNIETIEALISSPPAQKYTPPAPQDGINNNLSGGIEDMEIKNLDELRAAFPDLLAQAETSAKNQGIRDERDRIKGIEEIEAAIGNPDLIKSAKYGEQPMNAEQLAFAAMKAQAAIGAKVLDGLEDDAAGSGASAVDPVPNGPVNKTEDQKAEELLLGCIAKQKEGK